MKFHLPLFDRIGTTCPNRQCLIAKLIVPHNFLLSSSMPHSDGYRLPCFCYFGLIFAIKYNEKLVVNTIRCVCYVILMIRAILFASAMSSHHSLECLNHLNNALLIMFKLTCGSQFMTFCLHLKTINSPRDGLSSNVFIFTRNGQII